ncbi:Apoptosis-inducing factor homolog [Seminavis robusta]|uniref:Apoptosis-inducing factor homolog n=1 Tax=Seminavis robusta TaxID=568900 RepID=A0A9N8DTL9_9STRA|nr:Apoptosis-inducing factor homolog [Seminavis robusta]|eukprot:Sro334_g119750.1 Apoptosis-inducing factor homolog (316) ;mRNA; r:26401-27452
MSAVATNTADAQDKPKVLVIGGGIAGTCSIFKLRKYDKDVEIVLVEPKDYCEIPWVTFRTPFDSDLAHQSVLPLAPWAKDHNVTLLRTTVTKLDDTQATCADGTVVKFTVAVLCTGATAPWAGLGRGPLSLSKAERLAVLQAEGDKLLQAKSVCIVGGGLIGAEVAGTGDMIQAKLEKIGVKVVVDTRAEQTETGVKLIPKNTGTSEGGEQPKKEETIIPADQVVTTIGISAVNQSFLDSKYLDEKGWIKVEANYRVQESKNLLAVGDCCNFLMNAGNQIFANQDKIGFNIKQVLDEVLGRPNVKKLKIGGYIEV